MYSMLVGQISANSKNVRSHMQKYMKICGSSQIFVYRYASLEMPLYVGKGAMCKIL